MDALNQFYADVLAFAGLHPDHKGVVLTESNKPVILQGGAMMVLPYREQLLSLTDDKEVFHPLSEDTLVKMSKPLMEYQTCLNIELNVTFATIAMELAAIACSPARNREMASHPERLGVLRSIEAKGSENLTMEKNEKLLNWIVKMLSDNPTPFFVFSARRGGEYKGERQTRTGYTSFSLYHKLKEDLNVARKDSQFPQLSKEQVGMLVQIYETVFPNIQDPEGYNFGYNSGAYPFFSTVLGTAHKLAEPLNRIIHIFQGTFSSEDDSKPLNLSWKEVFDDKEALNKLRYLVGNLDKTSELEKGPARVETPKPAPAAAPTPSAPAPAPTPVAQTTPTKVTGRERVPLDEFLKTKGANSGLAMQGNMIATIEAHNRGYVQWFTSVCQQQNGLPPAGFPHPSQIPQGAQAPMYPGSPLAAMQPPQQAQMMYQQPPQVNAWGQPVAPQQVVYQQAPQVNAWGQPVAPQQMVYQQPQVVQQQQNWGQPMVYQQPQVNAWGQPVQQTAWNQPQTFNGSVRPGCR